MLSDGPLQQDVHFGAAVQAAEAGDGPISLRAPTASELNERVLSTLDEFDDLARQRRVQQGRGWSPDELERRELAQLPLDRKRQMAHDMIRNDHGEVDPQTQVRQLLDRITSQS